MKKGKEEEREERKEKTIRIGTRGGGREEGGGVVGRGAGRGEKWNLSCRDNGSWKIVYERTKN